MPARSTILCDGHGNTHGQSGRKNNNIKLSFRRELLLVLYSFISLQLMPDETTPILHHVRRRTTGNTEYDSLNDSGRPSRQDSRVLQSRRSSFHFMKRRTGAYDEDSQGLINENTGIRVWYENYSSIGKSFCGYQSNNFCAPIACQYLLMF